MAHSKNLTKEKLRTLIEERGKRVLPKFKEAAISGVSDPEFLRALHFVCDYWKDNFRPAFASFCCEAVGGKAETSEAVSLMVTLTSAGGGIHDDLLDKSFHKHFRKTVLGEFGSDCTLLVGDHLILKGWTLAQNLIEKYSQPEKLTEILGAFGSWTLDVCEAEFMEIQCRQNLETSLEYYQNILYKSMADIQACARLGAIMGGGSKSETQSLSRYARQLGFLYRLADDFKDTLNLESNLKDRLRHESVPLPILYVAKTSDEKKFALKNLISKSATDSFESNEVLKQCLETRAFEYLQKRATESAKEALNELSMLKDSSHRTLLAFVLDEPLAEIASLSIVANSHYQHGLVS